MTVNKERVRLLVDALRSGEFEQCEGRLRSADDKYCCLGVGAEIARRHGIGIEWDDSESHVCEGPDCKLPPMKDWKFNGVMSALGPDVLEWYGFAEWDFSGGDVALGRVTLPDDLRVDLSAIGANDDFHLSFEKIADLIEARYLTEEVEGK